MPAVGAEGDLSPGRASSLRLPAHRASTATLAGAYPFLAPRAIDAGSYVGVDVLTGQPFCFDPWQLYADGHLTNPNMLLAGVIGQGKSALAKSLAVRSIAAGRRVYVPGDPKGEWAVVAEAVGGQVVRLGPGRRERINPLDVLGDADTGLVHARRLRLLAAVCERTLGRALTAAERAALEAAVAACRGGATVGHVIDQLARPDLDGCRADATSTEDRAAEGRDVAHALRRLVRGDLAGMFDGPSTRLLNVASPMVVLDLSRLGGDEAALSIAMTCASAWLEAALVDASAGGGRWIIYDEAWRLMRSLPLVRRMQEQWKLSRAYGIANMLILHRLSDLAAVGDGGSEGRALAEGLLADCSTRIVYRQEPDQLEAATLRRVGLGAEARELLPALTRGIGLWRLPSRTTLVQHLRAEQETIFDTDAAMATSWGCPAGGSCGRTTGSADERMLM